MAALIFFGVCALILAATILYIMVKVRSTLCSLFGAHNLAQLKDISEAIDYDAQNTPKSVSGMTSVYLPRLQADFPELNWMEFQEMARGGIIDKAYKLGYTNIKIHKTVLNDYVKSSGTCYVTTQSAVEYMNTQNVKTQSRFNVIMTYVMDATLAGGNTSFAINCPNCGSPITSLGMKHCQYCGSAITEVNRNIWHIERVEELR